MKGDGGAGSFFFSFFFKKTRLDLLLTKTTNEVL